MEIDNISRLIASGKFKKKRLNTNYIVVSAGQIKFFIHKRLLKIIENEKSIKRIRQIIFQNKQLVRY